MEKEEPGLESIGVTVMGYEAVQPVCKAAYSLALVAVLCKFLRSKRCDSLSWHRSVGNRHRNRTEGGLQLLHFGC